MCLHVPDRSLGRRRYYPSPSRRCYAGGATAEGWSARSRPAGELRESEERFRQLLELSGDALFIHDDQGRIHDCNSEACRYLGYSREELLSTRISDFMSDMIPEGEIKKGGTLWERAMFGEPGSIVGVHVGEFRRKNGTTFPVEVSVLRFNCMGRLRHQE